MINMEYKFRNMGPLCSSMARSKKDMEQFQVTINGVIFDCIINIGSQPFELMVGTINYKFSCILHIKRGYVTELSDTDYFRICDILDLHYSINHFTSSKFLEHIDNGLPQRATNRTVKPQDVARYKADILSISERKEGYIFCDWLRHEGQNNGHARNIEKTRLLLGNRIANFCKEHDISSKWTTDETKEQSVKMPED